MSDQAAFLEAIQADPDADGPRLVFADWLQERGDPRGEFVRLQVELARLADDDPRRPELAVREQRLLAHHASAWLDELPELPPGVEWGPFERGFVASVTAADWRAYTTAAIQFFDLGTARGLRLFRLDDAGELGASLFLGRFTSLDLRGCRAGRAVAEVIGGSRYVTKLAALDLSGNDLDGPAARALAAGRLEALTLLDLANNRIPDAGVKSLARGPALGRLAWLNLSFNPLTAAGVRGLTASDHLDGLATLSL